MHLQHTHIHSALSQKLYKFLFTLFLEEIQSNLFDLYQLVRAYPLLSLNTHQEQIQDLPMVVMRNTLAKRVDDAGLIVNLSPVANFVEKNVDAIDALGGFGATVSGVSQSKALLNMIENPTVANTMQLRSISKAMVRSLEADKVTATTPAVGLLKQIIKKTDAQLKATLHDYDAMMLKTQGLQGFSEDGLKSARELAFPEVPLKGSVEKFGDPFGGMTSFQLLEASDAGFGKHYEKFFNPIVNKIKKSINLKGGGNPAALADQLVKPERKNSLNFVKAAKEAWPASEWPRVQRAVIDRIRDGVTDFSTKRIDGEALAKLFSTADDLGAPNRMGENTLIEIFGKDLTKELQDFSKALAFAQKANPTNVGSVATSISQGGGIIGGGADLLKGQVLDAAQTLGLVLGVPNVFARLMTNKTVVRAFTKGLKMKPNNPAWPALYGRIVSAISAANVAERLSNSAPIPTTTREDPLARQLLSGPALTQ